VRGPWLVAFLIAFGAPSPATAADPDLKRLKPGVFLYASPQTGDPNFAETVVMLVEYGPKGAMGLVIDHLTEANAADVLPNAPALRGLPLHWGGPVQPDAILGVVRTSSPSATATRLIEDVFLTGRREDLETAARGGRVRERVRVYAGYTGWGPGQLESEFARQGWVLGPGSAAAIFAPDPSRLWPRVFQLLERRQVFSPQLSLASREAGP
jgi:putative transcriptional regulator